VVIHTGELCEKMHDDFISMGFNGVITKPAEDSLLLQTICGIIEEFFYRKKR
jgi:hypothetical protein